MTYLTFSKILDTALSLIQDNSTPMRSKMGAWLNVLCIKTLNIRDWNCLIKESAETTIVDNLALLPTDFGSVVSIRQNFDQGNFFFTPLNQLTDKEVYRDSSDTITLDALPIGYQLTPTSISFYPSATGSIYLVYNPTITGTYEDGDTTIFPVQFLPLFIRGCLDFYYEYDMDERAALSYTINNNELKEVKIWDNRLVPKRNRNLTYMRDRL